MKHAWLAVALIAASLAPQSKAAEIAASDKAAILISGRIGLGDASRFASLLSSLGRGQIEVRLDSTGGLLLEAVKIAEIVRTAGLTTRVPYKATCASACTLVFAAGPSRIAHALSRIAVHSAGMPDQREGDRKVIENEQSLAVTTQFARLMSAYGAPASVIAKLVTTLTDRTSVLTVAELEAWNVKIDHETTAKEISKTGERAKERVAAASPTPGQSPAVTVTIRPLETILPRANLHRPRSPAAPALIWQTTQNTSTGEDDSIHRFMQQVCDNILAAGGQCLVQRPGRSEGRR
jgi:hypothetical protein